MELTELFQQLHQESRAYRFCKDGLAGIGLAKDKQSAQLCVRLLREEIIYCFDTDFQKVIAENVESWYEQWKQEFNNGGIWVNGNTPNEKGIIICTKSFSPEVPDVGLSWNGIHGNERCFVFGEQTFGIVAYDHSRIYSKNPNAHFRLCNHSHGFIFHSPDVVVVEDAIGYIEDSSVKCHGRCKLVLTNDCTLIDKGHLKLEYVGHVGI